MARESRARGMIIGPCAGFGTENFETPFLQGEIV